jgi:hypothetical protein
MIAINVKIVDDPEDARLRRLTIAPFALSVEELAAAPEAFRKLQRGIDGAAPTTIVAPGDTLQ